MPSCFQLHRMQAASMRAASPRPSSCSSMWTPRKCSGRTSTLQGAKHSHLLHQTLRRASSMLPVLAGRKAQSKMALALPNAVRAANIMTFACQCCLQHRLGRQAGGRHRLWRCAAGAMGNSGGAVMIWQLSSRHDLSAGCIACIQASGCSIVLDTHTTATAVHCRHG